MIYWNYCDYRCEDCEHSFECPVALKEREQIMRVAAEGREFDPMEAVKETLDETLDMVRKMAVEKGVDLNALEMHEEKEPDFPAVERSRRFAIEVMRFTKEAENRDLSEAMQKAHHDLCWYSGLLSAKLYRCMSGKYEAMKEDDPEMREIEMGDAHKTAQVVAMAIRRCKEGIDGLSCEYIQELKRFYDDLKGIEKEFKAEFSVIQSTAINPVH